LGGRLFHHIGSPNKLTSGRDVSREVQKRLEKAGSKGAAGAARRAGDTG